jgi:hypothetical protein
VTLFLCALLDHEVTLSEHEVTLTEHEVTLFDREVTLPEREVTLSHHEVTQSEREVHSLGTILVHEVVMLVRGMHQVRVTRIPLWRSTTQTM